MNYFSFCDIDFKKSKSHLTALETPFGTRSVGESLSYCNRCGLCLQKCPSYVVSQEEPLSARGRNQVARLLLERKFNIVRNRQELLRLITTCSLCGRCTQACPGQVFTAQHMLELRRLLTDRFLPFSLQILMQWRGDRPARFYRIAYTGLFFRRLGMVKIMRFSGLANLLGLSWLHQADRLIPPIQKTAKKQWEQLSSAREESPSLIYIPSLETELFLPSIGLSVLNLASLAHKPTVWTRTCTGLFEYVYGNVRKSRQQLKKLITRYQPFADKNIPILTDSIDVYNFLKQAATLFENYPKWKQRATHFAAQVRFVTDIFPLTAARISSIPTPVALDESGLFLRGNVPASTAEKIMSVLFPKNFVHCTDRQADLPAFGYSFTKQNKAALLKWLSLHPLIKKEVRTLFVLSGWAAMEARSFCKKNAPSIQVTHIAQLGGEVYAIHANGKKTNS